MSKCLNLPERHGEPNGHEHEGCSFVLRAEASQDILAYLDCFAGKCKTCVTVLLYHYALGVVSAGIQQMVQQNAQKENKQQIIMSDYNCTEMTLQKCTKQ